VWLSVLRKPGYIGKNISGDWRLLSCGVEEDGKDHLERYEKN